MEEGYPDYIECIISNILYNFEKYLQLKHDSHQSDYILSMDTSMGRTSHRKQRHFSGGKINILIFGICRREKQTDKYCLVNIFSTRIVLLFFQFDLRGNSCQQLVFYRINFFLIYLNLERFFCRN